MFWFPNIIEISKTEKYLLNPNKNNYKGSLKKTKNIWMDLVHNGGGGFRAESTFARFFLLLM